MDGVEYDASAHMGFRWSPVFISHVGYQSEGTARVYLDLLAADIDEEITVNYIDRFLMYETFKVDELPAEPRGIVSQLFPL